MWAQIVNILIGLFLMVAPGIWQFSKPAADNNHIVAPLVLTFAITALWEVNRNARWFNVLAGVWLLVSVFIIDYSSTGMIINIISGILLIVLSFFRGKITGSYGGGWRSLFQKYPAHMQAADKH